MWLALDRIVARSMHIDQMINISSRSTRLRRTYLPVTLIGSRPWPRCCAASIEPPINIYHHTTSNILKQAGPSATNEAELEADMDDFDAQDDKNNDDSDSKAIEQTLKEQRLKAKDTGKAIFDRDGDPKSRAGNDSRGRRCRNSGPASGL
ncbi:hypothetical protein G7054_g7180 [Neopestalotiopsis clavispora]|nr:hypothetical protein G7054_g7180 [Neopestalotiopsis clavispora]